MAIYEKMLEAWNNRDVDAYWACLHNDWQMTWHSTGKVTDRTFLTAEQMKAIMESSNMREQRCIYENDDIIVEHLIMAFPDDTKEVIMGVWTKKDGKLICFENEGTPIK